MAPKVALKRNDPVDLMSVGVLVGHGLGSWSSVPNII